MTENTFGKMGSIILIVIAMVVFYLAFTGFFSKGEGAVKGLIGDVGETPLKIAKDVFQDETEIEEGSADKILEVFRSLVDVKREDCIQKFSFKDVEDRDFEVEVDGKRIELVKGDGLRIYPRNFQKSFGYIKSERVETTEGGFKQRVKVEEAFSLTNKLSKIDNEIFLGDYVFYEGPTPHFLDENVDFEFRGELFPDLEKRECRKI
jgi:hypothetical protein